MLAIEKIDALILKPVYEYLAQSGEDFKILVLPDHPTPLAIRTHSPDSVPFFLYDSRQEIAGVPTFTESAAKTTGLYISEGHSLLSHMIH